MAKRRITPAYIVFYILFLPDSWQIAIGIIAGMLIAPNIMPQDYTMGARLLLYFMVAVIGYAASRPLGKGIASLLKKIILGKTGSGV